MLTIRKGIIALVLLSAVALPFLAPQATEAVSDADKAAACEGLGKPASECTGTGASADVDSLVATTINILSWVIGVVAVIMIIVGGLRYVMSNGDSNSIAGAKNTILYAIIGLVIAVLAQGIVRFVLKRTTSAAPVAPTVAVIVTPEL